MRYYRKNAGTNDQQTKRGWRDFPEKGKIAMTLEQYHLAQNTIHHYVNY